MSTFSINRDVDTPFVWIQANHCYAHLFMFSDLFTFSDWSIPSFVILFHFLISSFGESEIDIYIRKRIWSLSARVKREHRDSMVYLVILIQWKNIINYLWSLKAQGLESITSRERSFGIFFTNSLLKISSARTTFCRPQLKPKTSTTTHSVRSTLRTNLSQR